MESYLIHRARSCADVRISAGVSLNELASYFGQQAIANGYLIPVGVTMSAVVPANEKWPSTSVVIDIVKVAAKESLEP